MKFTLSWLKEHLDTEASLAEITDALTDLGLEVDGVEDPADALGPFRICRVIEAVQHPNADRLRLCRVETWPNGPDGPTEEVQVVCGAPNAKTGLIGVFAPPGTHVPGTGVDLKPGVIRGVESNGMLCSEREMMISDDHDGIIELGADAPLGARYIDYADLNDPVIEIAITPNRPDALGVSGVARDLAARGLGTLIEQPVPTVNATFPCPIAISIDDDVLDKAPVFSGRLIRGVSNGPSPDWLQRRLRAIGLRPISALVDVTNFFTYDRNRPLHVFDADKVTGDALRVHWAKGGEEILALDDKTYTMASDMIAISDTNGVESIAGIMGGAQTGCTEDTVNVFVESAYWDPVVTASSGRRLKINSDARYRFERGIDPASCADGVDLATAMIVELCGGTASEIVTAGAVPDTNRAYPLDPARVNSLVGMDIPRAEQVRILSALGFVVDDPTPAMIAAGSAAPAAGLLIAEEIVGRVTVTPPTWRPDIRGEADLVEEIARVASLTRLEAKPLPRPTPGIGAPVLTPMQVRIGQARRRLAARGLNECVTYTFIDSDAATLFGGGDPARRLENPISSEMSDMRPSILPGLLQAAARNQARGADRIALFETGPAFHGGEPGEQTEQAAAIRVGPAIGRHWSGAARGVDAMDAKADAEAVLAALGAPVEKLMVTRDAPDWFHPGRSAMLRLGPKNPLAAFGELHPKVLDVLDVKGPAVAMTVFLENIPMPKGKGNARPALVTSDLQSVERDFAFVVKTDVEAEAILKAARGADRKLISQTSVFDIFDGKRAVEQLGPDLKSVAISVQLQPTAATLTDKEIDAVAEKVISAVVKATGAQLRT